MATLYNGEGRRRRREKQEPSGDSQTPVSDIEGLHENAHFHPKSPGTEEATA